MLVKTEQGMRDVKIPKSEGKGYNVTPENYIVPKGEENRFHVIQEVLKFSGESGERISKPRIQKYGAKAFPELLEQLKKQGFTVTVLHDPREFQAENEKLAQETKAENAKKAIEAKEKADQDKIKTGVAEALKAMGLTPEMIAAMNQPKKTETVKSETPKTTETKTEKPASGNDDKK